MAVFKYVGEPSRMREYVVQPGDGDKIKEVRAMKLVEGDPHPVDVLQFNLGNDKKVVFRRNEPTEVKDPHLEMKLRGNSHFVEVLPEQKAA